MSFVNLQVDSTSKILADKCSTSFAAQYVTLSNIGFSALPLPLITRIRDKPFQFFLTKLHMQTTGTSYKIEEFKLPQLFAIISTSISLSSLNGDGGKFCLHAFLAIIKYRSMQENHKIRMIDLT